MDPRELLKLGAIVCKEALYYGHAAPTHQKKEKDQEGRQPRSPKELPVELDTGQKTLEALFRDTGMDPDVRGRQLNNILISFNSRDKRLRRTGLSVQ